MLSVGTHGNRQVQELFSQSDEGGDGQLNRTEFCDHLYSCLQHWSDPKGKTISRRMLGKIFDYIDIDHDGFLSATEFLHSMRDLPDPILPTGYTPGDSELCDEEQHMVSLRTVLGQYPEDVVV